MNTATSDRLRVTVVSANGLYKSDIFSFPDPFAIITSDGDQNYLTSVAPKTITPSWNEGFTLKVNTHSILTIRVFDQKKFKKKEQGFLGVVRIQVGSVIDPVIVGDVKITRNLQITKGGALVEHGELTVVLSTVFASDFDHPRQPLNSLPPTFPRTVVEAVPTTTSPAIHQGQQASQRANSRESIIECSHTNTSPLTPPINEGRAQIQVRTSKEAISAWNRKFAEPRVHFERTDPLPFTTGRRLGGGGMGIVFETTLDGIPLALKRTYTRRLTDHQLSEIKIMTQISKKPHEHIVELIGSYIHQQLGGHELGLLIWPVAHCDLAAFLQDMDLLGLWIQQGFSTSRTIKSTDLESAVENLSVITGWPRLSNEGAVDAAANHLYHASSETLRSRFGCIANAVAWLHKQDIRHKDLKPSQILLSRDGLWLTDFGWSKDMSELTQSATSGGDTITMRYQSPERAQGDACGKAEDVFSLGCTFIEMAYQLAGSVIRIHESPPPWKANRWSFQANLDQVHSFLKLLKQSLYEAGYGFVLAKLITHMLARDPEERPYINEVVVGLSSGEYFANCCSPATNLSIYDTGATAEAQAFVRGNSTQRPDDTCNSSATGTYTSLAYSDAHGVAVDQSSTSMNSMNQNIYVYTPPPFNGQNTTQPISNTTITNQTFSQTFPAPPQNYGYDPALPTYQRAATYTHGTTAQPNGGSRGLFKQVTNVLSGLDRQINGLVNDDRTGRSLISQGPAPLPGFVKAFKDSTR